MTNTNQKKSANNNIRSILEKYSEGILLAIVPFFGYITGLLFELGYGFYFRIPAQLIKLNFPQIMLSVFAFIFYLTIVWAILETIIKLLLKLIDGPFRKVIQSILPVFVLVIPFIVMGMYELLWVLVITLLIIILPGLFIADGKSFLNKIETHSIELVNYNEPRSIYHKGKSFLIMIFFLSLIVFFFGFTRAMKEETFSVLESRDMVMLRVYGEHMILKEFNRKTRKMESGIHLVSIPEMKRISIREERIGPLHYK